MKKSIFLLAMLPLSFNSLDIELPQGRAFDPRIDNPSRLSPTQPVERNMMRIAEVMEARAGARPWSDRTWDHNMALLGERYTDRRFMQIRGWPERKMYNERYSPRGALELPYGDPVQDSWLAALSPAEKYDVIMGTVEGGLYDRMAATLDRDMDRNGRFPGWWGICEGSAAAALASPEPTRTIVVHSEAYGVDVPFYAADVKGLVSMLWSSYNQELRLPEMGQQCQGSLGDTPDSRPTCFDVNPGSLMMVLHHFIGRGNGNLIIDTDASRVVWNHPVTGYRMSFYRPGAPDEETNFQGGLRRVGDGNDPRRSLRAPNASYILGVRMELAYGENEKIVPKEGSVDRRERAMKLAFELELDGSFNVLGGEWLTKKHPDIVWTIPRGLRPDSAGDRILGGGDWDGRSVPATWNNAALRSAENAVPLRRVVEGLVRRSAGRE